MKKEYLDKDYFINFFQTLYPVGALYLSINDTNPASLFGFGEWEQIKDRFLLAAGDTYIGGSTGGEIEHILTVNEMPKHRHQLKTDIDNPAYDQEWPEWFKYNIGWTQEAGITEAPPTHTTYEGGNQPHNNMPPYLVIYIRKRTS